jgi:hypothetical protein
MSSVPSAISKKKKKKGTDVSSLMQKL